jgi:two-component system, chemotaxis family, chemotaxis protein CheY
MANLKIYVIDDDPIYQFMIKKMVSSLDYATQVISFSNGKKAIKFLKKKMDQGKLPNIIFLDINMPEMDGWRFLKRYKKIKASSRDREPHIYMVSSSKNPSDIYKAQEFCELSGFLTKPVLGNELKYVIKNTPDSLWPVAEAS